jgi:hypothetical protein
MPGVSSRFGRKKPHSAHRYAQHKKTGRLDLRYLWRDRRRGNVLVSTRSRVLAIRRVLTLRMATVPMARGKSFALGKLSANLPRASRRALDLREQQNRGGQYV